MGDKFDEAAVRREAYNFYFQDTWKARSSHTMNYGLRYEVNSRIHEAEHRTSIPILWTHSGKDVPYWDHTCEADPSTYNPQPPYDIDWKGSGRGYRWTTPSPVTLYCTRVGRLPCIVPNLWQDNFLTGGIPLATGLYASALPGVPLPFQNSVCR